MEAFYEVVIACIQNWGYAAIVVGMAMESACLPVPSELIFGFAGYLVFLGQLDFGASVAAGVAGGLLGSLLSYLAGRYGGRPLLDKYGRYVFLSQAHLETAQRWFDRYGLKAVFFARLLPIVRTFISLPAGLAGVPFGRFVLYTLLGSLPWTVALIYAGVLFGENWRTIQTMGHGAAAALIGAALLGALVWRRQAMKLKQGQGLR
ncbi:DedA family protein [Azotosporobacter soli]|uniref:DedA family protein n=1 Tax=Azotosporobacter soli TaxID=3055040 RepID=UPI0031FEE349